MDPTPIAIVLASISGLGIPAAVAIGKLVPQKKSVSENLCQERNGRVLAHLEKHDKILAEMQKSLSEVLGYLQAKSEG